MVDMEEDDVVMQGGPCQKWHKWTENNLNLRCSCGTDSVATSLSMHWQWRYMQDQLNMRDKWLMIYKDTVQKELDMWGLPPDSMKYQLCRFRMLM